MENPAKQIEKNISASFSYVKKDMLMLNDAFSDMHDKVQQLSLNHAMVLEEVKKLQKGLTELKGEKSTKKIIITKKKINKKSNN